MALLSVDSVVFSPPALRDKAASAHLRFHSPHGDHITLLAVYQAYTAAHNKRVCTGRGCVLGDGVYWERVCTGRGCVLGDGVYWEMVCTGRGCVLGDGVYWEMVCTGRGCVLGDGVYWEMVCTGRGCVLGDGVCVSMAAGHLQGWCRENFIHQRNMRTALDVRAQLVDLCGRHGVPLVSNSDGVAVRRAVLEGLWGQTAHHTEEGRYLTVSEP